MAAVAKIWQEIKRATAGKLKFRRSEGSQAELESEKCNQPNWMKPTAKLRKVFSAFARTLCRGSAPLR
jgi:hypothetical protein